MDVATMVRKEIVRTPKELAPLIKEQVRLGDMAAAAAGMVFYRKAGGLMEEARNGVRAEGKETFIEYCERTSGKVYRTCQTWINAHHEQVAALEYERKKGKSGSRRPPKLSNSLRE